MTRVMFTGCLARDCSRIGRHRSQGVNVLRALTKYACLDGYGPRWLRPSLTQEALPETTLQMKSAQSKDLLGKSVKQSWDMHPNCNDVGACWASASRHAFALTPLHPSSFIFNLPLA